MRMEDNFYNQQGKNLEERTQEGFRLKEKRFTKLLVLLKEAKKGEKKDFAKNYEKRRCQVMPNRENHQRETKSKNESVETKEIWKC